MSAVGERREYFLINSRYPLQAEPTITSLRIYYDHLNILEQYNQSERSKRESFFKLPFSLSADLFPDPIAV